MDAKPRVGKFAESSFSGSFHSVAGVACERFKKVKFLGCCKFLAFSDGKKFRIRNVTVRRCTVAESLLGWSKQRKRFVMKKLRQIIICNKYVMKILFCY